MEEYLYGRYTTLVRLDKIRNDPTKHKFTRSRANRSFELIKQQLHDKKLNLLRERLIKAARAGDLKEEWKIQNLIREYTKDYEAIEREQ